MDVSQYDPTSQSFSRMYAYLCTLLAMNRAIHIRVRWGTSIEFSPSLWRIHSNTNRNIANRVVYTFIYDSLRSIEGSLISVIFRQIRILSSGKRLTEGLNRVRTRRKCPESSLIVDIRNNTIPPEHWLRNAIQKANSRNFSFARVMQTAGGIT